MAGFIDVLLRLRDRTSLREPQGQLKVPLRSLKRSSGPGARASGVWLTAGPASAAGAAFATDVSDEFLPHNSRTVGEIGCARSPLAWNSERKIGSLDGAAEAEATVTGVTARTSGKLER